MRLLIGNTDIELQPGETIVLTRSNAQVGRLGTRSGSFTNDFNAAMSANNLRALGYPNRLEITNQDINPNKKIDAVLKRNTGGEIARGYIQIVGVDNVDRTIAVTFFTGNSGWVTALKGNSIRDIYLRDYDHEWSVANIAGSWGNTDGYIYPFIDYGRYTFQFQEDTFIDDWYPAVFQSTLIRRMFEAIGWKASGSFLNTWDYKQCIIPFTNSQFLEDNADELEAEARKPTSTQYRLTDTPASGTSNSQTDIIDFDTIIKDNVGALDIATDRYTADRTLNDAVFTVGFRSSTATISFANAVNTDATIKIQIRKNGSMVVEQTILEATDENGTYNDSISDNFIISTTQDMVAGDFIDVVCVLEYTDAVAASTIVDLIFVVGEYVFQLSQVNPTLLPGGNVTLANNLPDIDQAAFVKDMVLRHGLLTISDEKTQTVFFEPISAFRNNTQESQDWSQYVTNLNLSSINFTEVVSDFGRKSRFKYLTPSEDDDYLTDYNNTFSPNFGDGDLIIDNDFVDSVKDIYTSPFAGTVQIASFQSVFGDVFIPYIPRISYDGSESLVPSPRILYVVQNTPTNQFIPDGGSVFIDGQGFTETAFAFFSKPLYNSDLDIIQSSLAYEIPEISGKMGVGLLDKYYGDWQDILNDSKYVRLGVKIFSNVFDDLRLDLPVFIDDVNIKGYFLVDQVIFRDDQESEIRLIKI